MPIQQYSYTSGKNATDSAMIIDAMDILYTGNVDGFCLVTSDSDFTRLASRLRESGMMVVGMGEQKTPKAFTSACNKFKYLDILAKNEESSKEEARKPAARSGRSTRSTRTTRPAVEKPKPDPKEEIAEVSNPAGEKGTIADVMKGADVFLGLSGPGSVDADMVKTMAKDAIVFAMANPTPEIYPDEAAEAGAVVIATGRSDFPNQINNCLGFPGIFRGALDVRASVINEEMKLAAAYALADLVSPEELRADWIIPEVMDKRVVPAVAKAVAEAAKKTGVARI